MQHLIENAAPVAESFFALTKSIRDASPLGPKLNELVILGVFVAHGGTRGIQTHVERAQEHGATREEIVAAITLALPVVGISRVNEALEVAIRTIQSKEGRSRDGTAR
ncbi:MAG TPA: carboxymuconolactone decarboxylase family protein [Polyangiaceae bacterium]|nr:carboxymuconolactone decarboxylase family protein [Polyangiaceae bacterium]